MVGGAAQLFSLGDSDSMTRKKKFWLTAFFASIVFHCVFCIQALSVAHQGGLVRADTAFFPIFFFPHTLLMYFLPPSDPFSSYQDGSLHIDWWSFVGKLVVAYPASFAYGVVVAAIAPFIWRGNQHENPSGLTIRRSRR
jgi:hypothetical protein